MMRTIISFILLSLSFQAFAKNCIVEVKAQTLKLAAKSLKVPASSLVIRHIGGETGDGDINGAGQVVTPSQEFFDVFYKNGTTAAALYLVDMEEVAQQSSGKVVKCSLEDVIAVPKADWENIYNTYL